MIDRSIYRKNDMVSAKLHQFERVIFKFDVNSEGNQTLCE